MARDYEKAMRDGLRSVKESSSKAITQAVFLYDQCMMAEDRWKQGGPSMIHHIWKKIEEYGDFPMLSEKRLSDEDVEKKYDLTWLLAFFNNNRTVLHSIVPRVFFYEGAASAHILFYPQNNIFTFLKDGISQLLEQKLMILIFDLIKLIAEDVGIDYAKTIAPKDVIELMSFMKHLYSISVPDLDDLLDNEKHILRKKGVHLSEVDSKMKEVNWTEYLLLVSPPEAHRYILSNPKVYADIGYLQKIDTAIRFSEPRTVINFVIIHYILSWVTLLEAKYRKLVYDFAQNVGSSYLVKRSEVCYDVVSNHYRHVVLATYARSQNYGNGAKPILEEMMKEIIASFKDQLNENTWIEDDFRKAVFKKLDHMGSTLLYDDVSANDTALDGLYSEHLKIGELPFLSMLDEISYAEKKVLYRNLFGRFDPRQTIPTIAAQYARPTNAFYFPSFNVIVVPLGIVQHPIFDIDFPRAYIYGTIGSIVGHEISHGFDNRGIKYDYNGAISKWYKEEWIEKFNEKTQCYVHQYGKIRIPIFDEPLNATLTLPDNIADNEGLKIAYRAFKRHQKKYGKEPRTEFFEDFSNDQLFFIGFAKPFCTKMGQLAFVQGLKSNHTHNIYRVNNAAMNIPEFADAFHCPPGSNMNPDERCSVW